jgi:N-succinyldiaminopimelate aminotransferase
MMPASTASTGLEAMVQGHILSPFTRVRRLLDPITPGHAKPIEMTAGDPRETMPGFVIDRMSEARELL